mgnify:FL=1
MRKLAIVGAGQAGCLTALHFYKWAHSIDDITIYHDPDTPMEETGQGTTLSVPELLTHTLGINLIDNNPIKATIKSGLLYEGWSNGDPISSPFTGSGLGYHYIPKLLSEVVLNSGKFKVETKKIVDPESEIDSDWIFDCRGRLHNNSETSNELVNPLNSVLLSNVPEVDPKLNYTRCVATPNGWTFVIPNFDSTSYGYLYNKDITTKEDATVDFKERFGVDTVKNLEFRNYMEDSIWSGERTVLNGNRFCFLEPLEATSTDSYLSVARHAFDHIVGSESKDNVNFGVQRLMRQNEKFILSHYWSNSIYDTPFWEYAKNLNSQFLNKEFEDYISMVVNKTDIELYTETHPSWGSFGPENIKRWYTLSHKYA